MLSPKETEAPWTPYAVRAALNEDDTLTALEDIIRSATQRLLRNRMRRLSRKHTHDSAYALARATLYNELAGLCSELEEEAVVDSKIAGASWESIAAGMGYSGAASARSRYLDRYRERVEGED